MGMLSYRAIRGVASEQFQLMATYCSAKQEPLMSFVDYLFQLLSVSFFAFQQAFAIDLMAAVICVFIIYSGVFVWWCLPNL